MPAPCRHFIFFITCVYVPANEPNAIEITDCRRKAKGFDHKQT